MARPKKRDQKDVRALVLNTALRLFLKFGYRKVTMRKIAEEIGYTPGTIYLYFKNKAEILYELHNEGFKRLQERRTEATETSGASATAIEKLTAAGKNYIAFALENPELYELMFFMREPRDYIETTKKRGSKDRNQPIDYAIQTYENLKQGILNCMDEGYLNGVDPELAAFFHWSLGHGLVSLAIRSRIPFLQKPTKELASAAIDLATSLIEATGNPRHKD